MRFGIDFGGTNLKAGIFDEKSSLVLLIDGHRMEYNMSKLIEDLKNPDLDHITKMKLIRGIGYGDHFQMKVKQAIYGKFSISQQQGRFKGFLKRVNYYMDPHEVLAYIASDAQLDDGALKEFYDKVFSKAGVKELSGIIGKGIFRGAGSREGRVFSYNAREADWYSDRERVEIASPEAQIEQEGSRSEAVSSDLTGKGVDDFRAVFDEVEAGRLVLSLGATGDKLRDQSARLRNSELRALFSRDFVPVYDAFREAVRRELDARASRGRPGMSNKEVFRFAQRFADELAQKLEAPAEVAKAPSEDIQEEAAADDIKEPVGEAQHEQDKIRRLRARLVNAREGWARGREWDIADLDETVDRRHVVVGDIHGDLDGFRQDLGA